MITMREREIIRSALGLNNPDAGGVGYRNRFYAGGNDVQVCRGLVAKGMAMELDAVGTQCPFFVISTLGFEAAKRRKERMDDEETAVMKRIDQAIRAREAA